MGKLKQAAIAAQENAIMSGADEIMLWCAQEALTAAIQRPDKGLVSAEKALHLINTYLMEAELCKR